MKTGMLPCDPGQSVQLLVRDLVYSWRRMNSQLRVNLIDFADWAQAQNTESSSQLFAPARGVRSSPRLGVRPLRLPLQPLGPRRRPAPATC